MHASVETLDGLERKIIVVVPAEKIEAEVNIRLNDLSRTAKMPGFRSGKIPKDLIRKRFAKGLREKVALEMIQPTLQEILVQHSLLAAGVPDIEPGVIIANKDFTYVATLEIFPKIDLLDLSNEHVIEHIESEVTELDVEEVLSNLRQQHIQWQIVDREVVNGDKVIVDFVGYIDDQPFDGGQAENYEIIIGSNNMIAGFESALIGLTVDDEKNIQVIFPDDYHKAELSGKMAIFKTKIISIEESSLLPLDDEFAKKFNITEGGIEALKEDLKQQMVRELEMRVSSINREKIYTAFVEHNPVLLPKSLIDMEIKNLQHELYHRIYGNEHSDNEKIPDFKREMFEDRAKYRVHLGLLFSEYVKQHNVVVEEERTQSMISKLSSAYENAEAWEALYTNNKERRAEVEAMVLDHMVAELIANTAKMIQKVAKYTDVMNMHNTSVADKGE